MYIAPVDATLGEAEWRPFVQANRFGHLVAAGRGRDVPVVVPTQFLLDTSTGTDTSSDSDTVSLHLVRANPIFEALAENPQVLLSIAGDWAFIPSAWKALDDEDPLLGIPTTYYGAVQLIGTATIWDERTTPGSVAAILRRQLESYQPDMEVADPEVAHPKRLQTILGLSVAVDTVRAKFKYGGNVDEAHRLAVVDRLAARQGPGDAAAAAQVARRLATPGRPG
jgi:transcriptional regulator